MTGEIIASISSDIPQAEKRRFSQILRRIPKDANRVLDIGCVRHSKEDRDKGSLHSVLNKYIDGDVIGIDVLEPEIKQMRNIGYDVRLGDMESLSDVVSEPVDTIIAGEVIEHVPNPGMALSSCENVLNSDGRVILTTPNPDGFVYLRKSLLGQNNNQTHTCWIDPQNLSRLIELSPNNFVLEETTYLPPDGGISGLIWRLGYQRAAAPGYIATLERD